MAPPRGEGPGRPGGLLPAGPSVRVMPVVREISPVWVSEDRHDPLAHIALLPTALKSAYGNTAFLPTRTSAELRELLIPGGREWWPSGLLFFICGRDGIA